jgi:N-acyl-D-amino-acid deacylase
MVKTTLLLCGLGLSLAACGGAPGERFDVVIRNGTVYDGSGALPFTADLALEGDRIASIGDLAGASGRMEIDADGLAVAPGFINMLSWAVQNLLVDGRSMSDIYQGVTLEVFGEGWSMGPLSPDMKEDATASLSEIDVELDWTNLADYLETLERRGVSPNVASFVGATTLRIHEIGENDRPPTEVELGRMRELVRQAMEQGALGVGSSLVYAPAIYADTSELVALCEVAASYDGMYISHLRSEGDGLFEALDELITIARETGIRAEIYHLKAAGDRNWNKLDEAIARVEAARAEGMEITADMYTYPASSTHIYALLPAWAKNGGFEAAVERMKNPSDRRRIATYLDERGRKPENILIIDLQTEALKPLIGKTVAEVAELRASTPAETIMDLIVEDDSTVGAVFFIMSEDNVRKKLRLPWVSFGSDGESIAPEGNVLQSKTHPRSYGNFARLLGRYVRDEQLIPLEQAIHRLTALPAANLKIRERGALAEGYYADVVVFDPVTIQDHATFEEPHQLATGMAHVFVNGVQVLADGEHTGATPGRVVRGPGWTGVPANDRFHTPLKEEAAE